MDGGLSSQPTECNIADTLRLWDVAVATIFGFCMKCTLAPPGAFPIRRPCDNVESNKSTRNLNQRRVAAMRLPLYSHSHPAFDDLEEFLT